MPSYDYRCNVTGEVVEVRHPMSELLATWGEVCERSGKDPGATPRESPVTRLITASQVIGSSALRNPEPPPCGAPQCCNGGMCGVD